MFPLVKKPKKRQKNSRKSLVGEKDLSTFMGCKNDAGD